MATLEIGQKGKLGNEVLTVVSFNEMTFKCDNGKSYMIATARWMTEGIETAATVAPAIRKAKKEKKARKYNAAPEDYLTDMTREEADRVEAYMANAKFRQAGSSLRK
jgi:hypothetical protein